MARARTVWISSACCRSISIKRSSSGMLSPLAMGIYAVALSLARIISAVHVGLATLMLPTVIGYSTEALTAAIARSARLAAVVTAAIGLAIVVAGPLLVGLLYGGAYASAGALLPFSSWR
jgi:O-antigen/teichoic acid export membrane protein